MDTKLGKEVCDWGCQEYGGEWEWNEEKQEDVCVHPDPVLDCPFTRLDTNLGKEVCDWSCQEYGGEW